MEAVRLFFDADGGLYDPSRPLPMACSERGPEIRDSAARLEWLLTDGRHHHLPVDAARVLSGCQIPYGDRSAAWVALLPDLEEGYRDAQRLLLRRAADAIRERAVAVGATVIVVLIHGYTNDASDARAVYASMESRVMDYLSSPAPHLPPLGHQRATGVPIFVEVYWNGGATVSSWSEAQGTGPLVGLSLRGLLNSLHAGGAAASAELPVVVLTHSSGAFVAASIVGDATAALPLAQVSRRSPGWDRPCAEDPDTRTCDRSTARGPCRRDRLSDSPLSVCRAKRNYRFYADHAREAGGMAEPWGVPSGPALSIGMLAPATPASSFYGAYRNRLYGNLFGRVRLIFGSDMRDLVTGKGHVTPVGSFGATSLASGLSWRQEASCVRRGLERADTEGRIAAAEVNAVEFFAARQISGYGHGDHAAEAFLNRPAIGPFFDLLFAQGLGSETSTVLWPVVDLRRYAPSRHCPARR